MLRAAAIAWSVVGVSLIAHLSAGGDSPGAITFLLSLAGVFGYSVALTRSRVSATELMIALAAGQLVLHTVFMLPGGHHAGGLPMLAAHIAATVTLTVVLAHGERAAWALWCWLRPRLMLPAFRLGIPRVAPAALADTAAVPMQPVWLGSGISWRGPPQ